jgi:hypothetical protein
VQLIEKPFLAAEVASIEETRGSDDEAFALRRSVVERLLFWTIKSQDWQSRSNRTPRKLSEIGNFRST